MEFEDDIKIIALPDIFEKLKTCVKYASPNEACGLVFGSIKEVKTNQGYEYHYIGQMFECIESSNKSTVAFLMDNIEELNKLYQKAAQKYDMRLVSIFHSHPGGAFPSGIDRHNMEHLNNFKGFKNLIWTIMDAGNNDLNGFIYYNQEILQVVVKINKD
ncbi:MAG: Mov34/MPN/PAD-1 family protein [Promethearchaeota archaeon]